MKEMNLETMEAINGGRMSWKCWFAIGSYTVAIAGAGLATGGIGAFVIGQAGLYLGAASIIASCID